MFDYNQKLNHRQKILTKQQFIRLVENAKHPDKDNAPVVKFFDPSGPETWLISELDPETGIAFGFADLGQGGGELGYVDLNELIGYVPNRPFRLKIERDLHFNGNHPMSYYQNIYNEKGSLVGV